MKPIILFIGPPSAVEQLPQFLPEGYEGKTASLPSEAMEMLSSAEPPRAVVVSAKLTKGLGTFNTGNIISFARRKNVPVVIGVSGSRRVQSCMLDFGCTHLHQGDLSPSVADLVIQLVPVSR